MIEASIVMSGTVHAVLFLKASVSAGNSKSYTIDSSINGLCFIK